MKRIVSVMALLAASAAPASAGGDWNDDDYYESRYWRNDYRAYDGARPYRVPSYEVYIPYGAYFADEPEYYGSNCKVEREWKRDRYKEKIECDDD